MTERRRIVGAMTNRTVALRLDDTSPLFQALRRYAFDRGILNLSQAAKEVLSATLLPKENDDDAQD